MVLYIGACTLPPNVCILTEWCAKGSLYDVLHDFSVHLPAKLCIDLAMGIAQGMNYLHSLEKKVGCQGRPAGESMGLKMTTSTI